MAGFVTGLRDVERSLEALYTGERRAIANAMREICSVLADWAKTNHDWMPETGNTDASTRADIVKAGLDEIVVALSAGMSYDVFLELAHSGRWAWLWPAMTANQTRILEILVKHCGVAGLGMASGLSSGVAVI